MTAVLSQNASAFLSMFDGLVDDLVTTGRTVDMEKVIASSGLKPVEFEQLKTKLSAKVDELELLVIAGDDQIVEGYSNMPKATQRQMLAMYHAIMEVRSTKITRSARNTNSDTDGPRVSVYKPKKVVATTETFSAVYAPSSKYKMVRVFEGNVTVTGDKVTADLVQEVNLGKNFANHTFSTDMSQAEIQAIVAAGKVVKFVPTTISSTVVDLVISFK